MNVHYRGESGDLPRQGLREPLKFVAFVEEIMDGMADAIRNIGLLNVPTRVERTTE